MCQYSAVDGFANDWHLVHLGRFALGGAGIIFVEATSVSPEGRITHGCLGLWSDDHVSGLRRIADFIREHGAVPAIQLGHAGRKASSQRPWFGNGPLDDSDFERGDMPWEIIGPSPVALQAGWMVPRAIDRGDMDCLIAAWEAAARRAMLAGFEVIEIHAAHGYLLHSFLSPLSNRRDDEYGGSRKARARFPLELVAAVRAAWPRDRPLFVRISAVDGIEGGWTLEDTIWFAGRLKGLGVDVIDCSSGGIGGSSTVARIKREPGYQVPFAGSVRHRVGIPTMAVGLILDSSQAESILADGSADIVAVGRQALVEPNWPHHALDALEGDAPVSYSAWPRQAGWWLVRRQRSMTI